MRIVITGITGFIGGAMARKAAQEGGRIAGLVRPSADITPISDLPIEFVTGDVCQPESLAGLFQAGDWVIHAAGMLGRSGVPESDYHALHVEGTGNVLRAAAKANVGRLLYISSPGVLGPVDGQPADETTPLAPSNPYERSKAAAEKLVLDFVAGGLNVVIARPEFVYGPGDLHVLGMFQAVQKGVFFTIGTGEAVCHPTYIDDAVTGMWLCLTQGEAGEIFHITGPCPVTFAAYGRTIAAVLGVRKPWLRLPKFVAMMGAMGMEAVAKVTGMTPPLSRTGVAFFSENRRFSWAKAKRELGYEPQVDLEEGVRRTIEWYRGRDLL